MHAAPKAVQVRYVPAGTTFGTIACKLEMLNGSKRYAACIFLITFVAEWLMFCQPAHRCFGATNARQRGIALYVPRLPAAGRSMGHAHCAHGVSLQPLHIKAGPPYGGPRH